MRTIGNVFDLEQGVARADAWFILAAAHQIWYVGEKTVTSRVDCQGYHSIPHYHDQSPRCDPWEARTYLADDRIRMLPGHLRSVLTIGTPIITHKRRFVKRKAVTALP